MLCDIVVWCGVVGDDGDVEDGRIIECEKMLLTAADAQCGLTTNRLDCKQAKISTFRGLGGVCTRQRIDCLCFCLETPHATWPGRA